MEKEGKNKQQEQVRNQPFFEINVFLLQAKKNRRRIHFPPGTNKLSTLSLSEKSHISLDVFQSKKSLPFPAQPLEEKKSWENTT